MVSARANLFRATLRQIGRIFAKGGRKIDLVILLVDSEILTATMEVDHRSPGSRAAASLFIIAPSSADANRQGRKVKEIGNPNLNRAGIFGGPNIARSIKA